MSECIYNWIIFFSFSFLLKEKKIAKFCCRTSCRSFLLLTESRFIYRNVIPLCKLLIITWKTIIPTLLTLFLFPLFIVFKLSFKTTSNSVFFPMLSYTAYGRNIIPPHICYSIKCANDWFFGQLHKCSLHPKNMRLCEVNTTFEGNLVLLYKIYTVSKNMCVEGFHTDRFFCVFFCIACFILKFGHISKVKIWIATDRSVSPHLAKWLIL